jgi:hypothetical protein
VNEEIIAFPIFLIQLLADSFIFDDRNFFHSENILTVTPKENNALIN